MILIATASSAGSGNSFLVILAAAGTGLLSFVGAWYVARRQYSGGVRTSEAQTLWSASEEIRKELRDETVVLRGKNSALEDANEDLKRELNKLRDEVFTQREEITELRHKVGLRPTQRRVEQNEREANGEA